MEILTLGMIKEDGSPVLSAPRTGAISNILSKIKQNAEESYIKLRKEEGVDYILAFDRAAAEYGALMMAIKRFEIEHKELFEEARKELLGTVEPHPSLQNIIYLAVQQSSFSQNPFYLKLKNHFGGRE